MAFIPFLHFSSALRNEVFSNFNEFSSSMIIRKDTYYPRSKKKEEKRKKKKKDKRKKLTSSLRMICSAESDGHIEEGSMEVNVIEKQMKSELPRKKISQSRNDI